MQKQVISLMDVNASGSMLLTYLKGQESSFGVPAVARANSANFTF